MMDRSLLTVLVVCCLVPAPVDAAEGVFDSNGVKIRYVTEGKGEPVVLIHGWMADSSMWGRDRSGNTKLNTSGDDGFQLIALDCRGHGKSDRPHDPAKYGAEMAADVVRLLDHLKLERAYLIGYSSGAFIAGKVAATHPERVLSVVYAGQAPLVAGTKSADGSEVELFARAVDEGKDLGAYIIAVTPPGKPKPSAELARTMAKFLFDGKDVKAFAAAGRSFKDLAVTGEQLKKCQAPILFIHGGNESDEVKNRVASVRKLLGRGDLKIIEGADHITTLTKPEFAAALREFLRSGKPEPEALCVEGRYYDEASYVLRLDEVAQPALR
jgi:pimeloyl-ACP methyl ester carboxylesterase